MYHDYITRHRRITRPKETLKTLIALLVVTVIFYLGV